MSIDYPREQRLLREAKTKCLSPLDGRYEDKTESLREVLSEYGLIKYKVRMEIMYLLKLADYNVGKMADIDDTIREKLKDISRNCNSYECQKIKKIEARTKHDVKAIEEYIKTKMDDMCLSEYRNYVHLGLTSEDINSTALSLAIWKASKDDMIPSINKIISALEIRSRLFIDVTMLSRTHGQPATRTKLGREILVFKERLSKQLDLLKQVPYSVKFGGVSGNMDAHRRIDTNIDWNTFAYEFIAELKSDMVRSYPTTQIEHYDNLAARFDGYNRIATILIDYARDMWQYVSMEYFTLRQSEGQVGSTAMPHKANPIEFENAEGNLGLARAIGRHFSEKLPISRLQRDLSESTVLRNIGVYFGYLLVAFDNILKGTNKLVLNKDAIDADLEKHKDAIGSEARQIQMKLHPEQYGCEGKCPHKIEKERFDKERKDKQQTN